MEANHTLKYDVDKSSERMDNILNASNGNYAEKGSNIPERNSLTFTNGYYVNVAAIFIDIVGSSNMTDEHKRPMLAKIYRAFISECVAILDSEIDCKEIFIHGDCVWGVFEKKPCESIDNVVSIAAKITSMMKILNSKLLERRCDKIEVGIGIDYGRALMIKAGYSGSKINDVLWMGDVVNSACHLCKKAGRDDHCTIIVSPNVYNRLSNENKMNFFNLSFEKWDDEDISDADEEWYEGDISDADMDEWYKEHCNGDLYIL